jgi:hypothetical protein
MACAKALRQEYASRAEEQPGGQCRVSWGILAIADIRQVTERQLLAGRGWEHVTAVIV